jgi:hypothetical protein
MLFRIDETKAGYAMLARREKIGYELSRKSWTPQEPLGPNTFASRHGDLQFVCMMT